MSEVLLTEEQVRALDAVARYSAGAGGLQPFFLGGYAGTGKTTLLRAIQEEPHRFGRTLFIAPTGKAVQVLQSKIPGAEIMTAHAALYVPGEVTKEDVAEAKREIKAADTDEEKKRRRTKYKKLRKILQGIGVDFFDNPSEALMEAHLVVVDEASMLGQQEYEKLVLVAPALVLVGDPAQLPPVQSKELLSKRIADFDAFLRTVHRAALDSPIIRAAMDIRNGKFDGWSKAARSSGGVIQTAMWGKKSGRTALLEADIVLTGTNKVRRKINRTIRKWLGRKAHGIGKEWCPVPGDKVIVKRNMRPPRNKGASPFSADQDGRPPLVNGDLGVVEAYDTQFHVVTISFPDGRKLVRCPVNTKMLRETYGAEEADKYGNAGQVGSVDVSFGGNFSGGVTIDYGYCITVHSAQGSEWDHVCIADDGMRIHDKKGRRRWLYTATTRAAKRLTVIKAH